MQYKSKDIAKASVIMAMSSREEEAELKVKYLNLGIKTAAVDIGGNVVDSISKILERALVASKRNGIISESHIYEGALTGATREAIAQIMDKAVGFNVGGKIGIAKMSGTSFCMHFFDNRNVQIGRSGNWAGT